MMCETENLSFPKENDSRLFKNEDWKLNHFPQMKGHPSLCYPKFDLSP